MARADLLGAPAGENVEFYEILDLRRFLQKAQAPQPLAGNRTIVVIDHAAARLYRSVGGDSESKTTVTPYDPHGFHRHLIHRKEAHYQGERVPEEDSFYKEIATNLAHSKEIVFVGHGRGESNPAEVLMAYLQTHAPEIASHVVDIEALDLLTLTEPEIEQEVKRQLA